MNKRPTDDCAIIVAVDAPALAQARSLWRQLDPALCRLKVGFELYTACGPVVVEQMQADGFQVFLDLKYHDIPNTVAAACRAAAGLGVWMVNVHASGGPAMLSAAAHALADAPVKPLLIGVTILTSLAGEDYQAIGYRRELADQVTALALLCREQGLDGVVCSPHEAARLRAACGEAFTLVTPGVRPAGSASGDQKRVMTPMDALHAGASHLVVGRPITAASDPLTALQAIHADITGVRASRHAG